MRPQESDQAFGEQIDVSRLTFPDHEATPSCGFEGLKVGDVTFLVSSELRAPVFAAARRNAPFAARIVLMPKAAVNEDDLLVSGEDDVRRSWQVAAMQPEPEPQVVNKPTDGDLRRHVLTANAPHVLATALRVQLVHGWISS